MIASLGIIAVLLRQQQQPTGPIVQPEPTTGGVYIEALIGQPARFNPLLDEYSLVDQDVDRLLYSSLLQFDSQGLPQPELAESWGISRDGTIYNLSLREDALWHDGQPVTSEDVAFTISLMQDPKLPISEDIRAVWKSVKVNIFDEYTLQFRLAEPFAPFLDYLTFQVVPKHIWDGMSAQELQDSVLNLKPVGSGPYRFSRLIVEEGKIAGVVLKSNEQYYLQPPYIQEVVFRFYPDAQTAFKAYQDGEVMGIGQVPLDVLPQALAEPDLNLYSSRLPTLSLVLLNLNNPEVPFLQEVAVRKALLQGLDRQWMVDTYLQGQGLIADGPIFPGTWAYYEGVNHVAYDPQAAVDRLKQAGYVLSTEGGDVREKDGQALRFTLLYPEDELHAYLASAIQEDWRQLGVAVELQAVDYETLVSEYLTPRRYQAALVDLNLSQFPDPDPYPFWHQTQMTGGQNYAQWDDRQASEYLEQARIMVEPGQRARLYRNFQVRFQRELPALPLFYPVYTYAVDNQVQGVRVGPLFNPSDRFATITTWFFVTKPGPEVQPTNTGESGE